MHKPRRMYECSSEKILTQHYTRVVNWGERQQRVILFPQHLQDLMHVLIDIRLKTHLVPEDNKYLFAHHGSQRWVRSDLVIRQFAQKCKIQNPEHMSSNKLRKQIATVMQILNLKPDETDQFAQFMGHTVKTHEEFYKLPQDVYRTAKVSKLLILMDKGEGHKHQGKSLSEIYIDPEIEVPVSEGSEDEESPGAKIHISTTNLIPECSNPSTSDAPTAHAPKLSGRSAWTPQQIAVVKNHFKQHIKNKKASKKLECEELIKKHPTLLGNKDWVRVKIYVYNSYRDK
ncbi:uncharacterized protein LOC107037467 [Diachasma alloeum]|uniref:uncharacterized protein LOC107037467 n=1 Tax=Diachasma alloeum TaxID=454923 RepID=UPI00073833C9|nr:uncharacterized protein LOC107037467 [Diachasma alloeum]